MFDIKGWVRLGKGEEKRIRDGHLWIYDNEIAGSGGDFEDGDVVWVEDARAKRIGTGYVNRHSVITVRLLSRGSKETFNEHTFSERLVRAIERRAHLKCDAKRLVNAEGDLLPGLIIDIYRDVLVVQTQTLGWEKRRDLVVDELKTKLEPSAIVLKNDSASRQAEGIERYTLVTHGQIEGNIVISEGGLQFEVDVISGQKTGFYIDQRNNRPLLLPWVKAKNVLDCFCYSGAWSIMCAHAGAASVRGLDSSQAAVDLAIGNAARNGVDDVTEFRAADVFDELPKIAADKEKFDAIILDPPSLARTRKATTGAERGYIHLNRLALGLLNPGGLLVTCSCSHHVSRDMFAEILKKAGSLARKQVMTLRIGGQPEDHPWVVGVPETDYLKCMVLRAE